MIIIQLENNTVTITRGGEQRSSADAAKQDTNMDIASAAAARAVENAPKKGGGDGGPTGSGGGDGGPTGSGGGDGGPTGSGGGGPSSVVVVGPIIMRGFGNGMRSSGNGQSRPVLFEGIKKQGRLGASQQATKEAAAHGAVASQHRGKDNKGGGDGGPTGSGGGGAGSMIVIGPIVIQDFAEEGATRSDPQGDSLGRAKAAQAAAGTGHKS